MNIDTQRIVVFILAIRSSADKRECSRFGIFLLRRFRHHIPIACPNMVICLLRKEKYH